MRLHASDLAVGLLRRSVRADSAAPCCSRCRRRLLPGELLHVYDGDRKLCTLCVSALPPDERAPLRSERIHVAERRLSVAPRAA